MSKHSFSAAGASRREVLLGGIIATLAAGLPNAGAFSRRCFVRPVGANQTSAGFCQGDAQ
jgi:hypothetical protein